MNELNRTDVIPHLLPLTDISLHGSLGLCGVKPAFIRASVRVFPLEVGATFRYETDRHL
jgi:hypothetical protein